MRGDGGNWTVGRMWWLGGLWLCMGCMAGCGLAPLSHTGELSLGRASRGVLLSGTALPARGEGFERALPQDQVHTGSQSLEPL